uniref:Olfactory receptor n=1 Tax=Dromaius novaehollandiae TaxID=8790 RepID=A0A8C4K3D4_DRONO
MRHGTSVTEFIFLSFSSSHGLQIFLFVFLSLVYMLTITGNIAIIVIVQTSQQLHTPMYLFLSNLAMMEIGHMSNTIPKMLVDFLAGRKSISVSGCITQLYFNIFLGATENFLLVAMAYDRYLAICHPLNYATVMNARICGRLAFSCWVSGFLVPLFPSVFLYQLSFCGPRKIDHFFCDLAPVLQLSCTDTSISEISFLSCTWTVVLGCFMLIMASYVHIIYAVLRMPSIAGQHKAFSTCTAHLIVVAIYYGSTIYMYVRPSVGYTVRSDKVVSVFYCVVTPFLNPFIYSLRNREVREAFRTTICADFSVHCWIST